jgi:hypothetical protein
LLPFGYDYEDVRIFLSVPVKKSVEEETNVAKAWKVFISSEAHL